MYAKNRWLHLWLAICFIVGWTVYHPAFIPGTVYAEEPPPPFPVAEMGSVEPQTSPLPPPLTKEEIEERAALDALEAARRQGPEAVVALLDILRGRGLDVVMDDVHAAQEQLARSAPPQPEGAPVSLEAEEAALQAQLAGEAAEWMQSQPEDDPREGGRSEGEFPQPEIAAPAQTTADRTVGAGCTYATIAAAISASNAGDRLLLEGGVTFAENVTVDKNLTLSGGYPGCASGSSARTTIQGTGSGPVLIIYESLTATLENLNITNGMTGFEGGGIRFAWGTGTGTLLLRNVHIYNNLARWGGGLWAGDQSVVRGTDVEIYNNTATAYGGGVRLFGAQGVFTDTLISNNIAPYGGGVYGTQETTAPLLNLQSFADLNDNQALTGDGYGGGIYMRQGGITITDCSDIHSNDAIQGGGAFLITSTLTIEGSCSEISSNTATGSGGGIFARASEINLDNQAEVFDNGADGGSGGGALLDGSWIFSDLADIVYNTARDYGGGVYATNNSILDMDLGSYPCSGSYCSRLANNTTSLYYGGGVFAGLSSEVDLRQVFVERNSALLGGGGYVSQSPIYLYNSLLARNNATGSSADGLRLFNGANLFGQHNTLAYNDAGGAPTGNAIAISGSTLAMSNSIVWGHTTSIDLADQDITYSDIQGGYTGTGNLNVDPLFVAAASSNYHLSSLSPVIDRCSTGQARDIDNELRPVYYDRPATPYDMGADEVNGRVGINGAACVYGYLQDAVDAAPPGANLQIVSGVLTETVNISGKNLTITGGYDGDCTTYITGTTTIDGGGAGSVLRIDESVLTLRDLILTGGHAAFGGGLDLQPGSSRITLDHTSISDNHANHGGGVFIDVGNVMTITNDTQISNNDAVYNGGGARVWGKLVGVDWDSAISGNTAANGGGVSLPGGMLSFMGSHITSNQAIAASGVGGGIHVESNGAITVTHSSNVSYNNAYNGAGIYADNARVHLAAVIHSNTAANHGGGVYLANGSSLSTDISYIGYAASGWGGNSASQGGGLYLDSSTLDFSGDIIHNTASFRGGGIFATASTLNLINARVGGAGANQANQLSTSGHEGAGMYLANATRASLVDTLISSNVFLTSGYTYGGGAYVTGGSEITMTNSTVELHSAPSASDGRGAGLYIQGSTLTLDNSQVVTNTAGTVGGGIRLFGNSKLLIRNDSELRNNHATHGEGGAVAAADTPDITIAESVLQDNSAGTHGGAIYLAGGSLIFQDWWALHSNAAGGNGGALAITGTGNAWFAATTAGSSILDNQANGNGGAIYLNNNSACELYSTAGYLFSLGGNQAGGHGGAGYADNGGHFDVWGRLVVTANRAPAGSGGAFYLSNGSRLWLDDASAGKIEMRENWAQNGGAIYAQDSPNIECDGASFGYTPEGNLATAGSGGAIYVDNSSFSADNCVFNNNRATLHGGAIAAYDSTLTIFASYTSSAHTVEGEPGTELLNPQRTLAAPCDPLTTQCSSINGNQADSNHDASGSGGAIYSSNSGVNVSYTYMRYNRAATGGAVYQEGASASAHVSNTLIYNNTVTSASGAGIFKNGGAFTVMHTTIANNSGGAGFSGTASEVHNSIAWGNDSAGFDAEPGTASCNIDQSGNAGAAVNPRFVAPGAGEDYHLFVGSPAVDVCITGLSPDLDNLLRPFGKAYDMGSFESRQRSIYLPVNMR